MDIDEITTFVAIAELGGFTRAAQRLQRTALLELLTVGAKRPVMRRQRIERPRMTVQAR